MYSCKYTEYHENKIPVLKSLFPIRILRDIHVHLHITIKWDKNPRWLMKTHILKSLTALALISLLLYGCKTETRSSSKNDIAFDSITVEKVYHLLESPENPNCNFQLKFIYPKKMGNEGVLKTVQEQFISNYFGDNYKDLTPEDAVAGYTSDYIASYKELEDDFKLEMERSHGQSVASWFSYYEMSQNEIEYNENDILSYSVSFSNYTGGAHGAHSTHFYVVDIKTGKEITEEDIFIENYQDQLAQVLVDKITTLNDVQDAKELENIGFFSVDEIFPNGNFLIDDTGITYAFNEYEIAAYVVGLIEVHIPFKDIDYLIKKDSPIAHLVF